MDIDGIVNTCLYFCSSVFVRFSPILEGTRCGVEENVHQLQGEGANTHPKCHIICPRIFPALNENKDNRQTE